MCGIAGYVGFDADPDLLRQMTAVMTHRGPDDDGHFEAPGVGLGMRRLSIIDVAGGHQPITDPSGMLTIVFNGEIYNYRELREQLLAKGHRFATHSDTETILVAYAEYGEACVQHLRGMFAFAIHDWRDGSVFVARDRLGIKPLYYWSHAGRLVFASELKAVLCCGDVPREVDPSMLDAYLSLRYVPGPGSLLQGVHKLPAACTMRWKDGELRVQRYWSPGIPGSQRHPDSYYRERFAELFRESVRIRLMSEVPLGAYLSGGVDSSAIVATMASLMDRPVQTFSVGFGWESDELPAARAVAKALGCDHHEVVCSAEHMQHLPRIVWHLDEPLGDAIVLPMYLLSELAKKHVTVVLSGEGADETLAGYLFHRIMVRADQYRRFVPSWLSQRVVQPAVARMPVGLLDRAFDYPGELGERGRHKLVDYLELVGKGDPSAEYGFLISLFDERDKRSLYTPELRARVHTPFGSGPRVAGTAEAYLDRVLELQYDHWLPDDILTKQDKMSMANGIEARVPFLDHRLVELLVQAPDHLKLGLLSNKKLLREYLRPMLPPHVARQKKRAFYVPLEKYAKTSPFKELLGETLSQRSVERRGYFEWSRVRTLLDSVARGEFIYDKQVFALVVLELWHRIFVDKESGWVEGGRAA